tara:strand:- start:20605 stop:21966 length:1362 start_codon:yes stop_codon:yes gene_type:complete
MKNMNTIQEKINKLQSIIKVSVYKEDYQENVDKILKDYRKKAVMPGFRKGKTPMSIIEKQYKTSVLVDEVNKLLQNELYRYISEENLKILGSPMPKNGQEIDWLNETKFDFEFEIGLSPEIDIKISKKDKIIYYKIEADDKIINKHAEDIAKRYGKMTNSNLSTNGDLIFCLIEQLDDNGEILENGIKNEATVSMDFISNKKSKEKFIGVKKDDKFKLNVRNTFSNNSDLAAMLNIKNKELDNLNLEYFQFTVKNISKLEPAVMNKELFDKIYEKGTVRTLKDFKLKIKEETEHSFQTESDRMLKNDVVNYLIKKNKFDIPDDFLKQWLVHNSEQSISLEKVDEEYDMYSKSLKWQLIENNILENFNITISQEELEEHTKYLISMQMKQYGQPDPDDNKMNEIVSSILNKDEERKRVHDQIYDIKTLKLYKETFKLVEKTISYDEFVKLASEK